jgi:transglutaminase-like putative cysteine protease
MWINKSNTKKILYLLLGSFFVVAINMCVLSATHLDYQVGLLTVVCVFLVFLSFGVFYNKYTILASLAVFLLFAFTVTTSAFQLNIGTMMIEAANNNQPIQLAPFEDFFFADAIANFANTILFALGHLYYEPDYAFTIMVFLAILLSIMSCIAFISETDYMLCVFLGASPFIVALITDSHVPPAAFVMFMYVALCQITIKMNKTKVIKHKEKSKEKKPIVIKQTASYAPFYALPVALMIIVAVSIIVAHEAPTVTYIGNEGIGGHFNVIRENISDMFSGGRQGRAGFTDGDTVLGGTVNLNNPHLVLEVHAERHEYLMGSAKDYYDGGMWSNTVTGYERLIYSDNDELIFMAVYERFNPSNVYFVPYGAKTVFLPIETSAYRTVYRYFDFGAVTDKIGVPDKSTYYIFYHNDSFLVDNRILNEERYTQLDETKTPIAELTVLAMEITQGLDDDRDKMYVLERYLATSFLYSTTPPRVTPNTDFVYDFLFNTKEGYCTYFASALAVLGRTLGIQTRFVEGYVMPFSPSGVSQYNESSLSDAVINKYTVTSSNAHAWVQAYFEDEGWVIFDPTPPHNTMRRGSVYDVASVGDDFIDVLHMMGYITPERRPSDFMPWQARQAQEEYERLIAALNKEQSETDVQQTNIGVRGTGRSRTSSPVGGYIVFAIVSILITVTLILLIYSLFRSIIRSFRINRMDDNRLTEYYYRRILILAGFRRYPIYVGETPLTYSKRIGNRFIMSKDDGNKPLNLFELTLLYNRARYSENGVTERELNIMRDAYEDFLFQIKQYMGKYSFFVYKYILRVIT